MRADTYNKPVRIHRVLREDIEKTQKEKFHGLVPFTQACYDYYEEKKKLESDNLRYKQKIEELTQTNAARRNRLL